jgi:hypothetical protein
MERSSGAKAGSRQAIGSFHIGVGKVMEGMGEEEIEEAADLRDEWNKTGPPPEVQAQ